jgi:hypothetical protein
VQSRPGVSTTNSAVATITGPQSIAAPRRRLIPSVPLAPLCFSPRRLTRSGAGARNPRSKSARLLAFSNSPRRGVRLPPVAVTHFRGRAKAGPRPTPARRWGPRVIHPVWGARNESSSFTAAFMIDRAVGYLALLAQARRISPRPAGPTTAQVGSLDGELDDGLGPLKVQTELYFIWRPNRKYRPPRARLLLLREKTLQPHSSLFGYLDFFTSKIGSYFKQTKSIKQAQSICQAATTFLSCIHPPISIPVVFVLGSDSPAPFLTHAAPCPDHLDVPFLNEYPCLSFSPPLFPRSFSLPSVLLLARRSSVSSTHCNKQRACTYAYAAAFIHPRTPQHTASSIATPPLH